MGDRFGIVENSNDFYSNSKDCALFLIKTSVRRIWGCSVRMFKGFIVKIIDKY